MQILQTGLLPESCCAWRVVTAAHSMSARILLTDGCAAFRPHRAAPHKHHHHDTKYTSAPHDSALCSHCQPPHHAQAQYYTQKNTRILSKSSLLFCPTLEQSYMGGVSQHALPLLTHAPTHLSCPSWPIFAIRMRGRRPVICSKRLTASST
jgi:hypothetical protein